MTYLDDQEGLSWLMEVHGVNTLGAACAILYGNEDSPERVEVFSQNDYRALPEIYLQGADGNLAKFIS